MTYEKASEQLVRAIVALQHNSGKAAAQVHWFRKHLNKTLTELEKTYGLEPMDWDPIARESYKNLPEFGNVPRFKEDSEPFYVSYAEPNERSYAFEDLDMTSLDYICKLGCVVNLSNLRLSLVFSSTNDVYMAHVEKRFKRLEQHLDK